MIGNRGGIPFVTATLSSTGSTTTNAVYTLPDHSFRNLGNVGIIIVTIPTASAATVTGVTISVNGQNMSLTTNDGTTPTTLAAADYIFEFNKVSNTLKYFA